jgi:hypothetical protein
VQLGALLFTMVLSTADINPVPPGTPEPGPLADPVPSSSGKKRKGKEEVSEGGCYNTRGWMKHGLDDAQSKEDRQNLAAAISLVYNGVTYDDAEVDSEVRQDVDLEPYAEGPPSGWRSPAAGASCHERRRVRSEELLDRV